MGCSQAGSEFIKPGLLEYKKTVGNWEQKSWGALLESSSASRQLEVRNQQRLGPCSALGTCSHIDEGCQWELGGR